MRVHKLIHMLPLLSLLLMTAMSGCSLYEAASYQSGYDHGFNAGLQDGVKRQRDDSVFVTVSGSFTATVRELIPDYVTDSQTPRAAVVTFFQDGPFVLKLDEAICKELETGETYTFTVDAQEAVLLQDMLDDEGLVSPDTVLVGKISVTGFHKAEEEESGLSGWNVYYTSWLRGSTPR